MKNFRFLSLDIRDQEKIRRIMKKGLRIIHLAARPGVRASTKLPNLYLDINVKGTLTLLNEAVKSDVEQFIFVSSSSVYGISPLPFREELPADKPLSIYAATKRCCEILLYTFSYNFSIPITCLRLFTVYGPRVRPDMAIYKFAMAIYQDKEVILYNEGKIKRDFTYISDVIDGILRALRRTFPYEIFNIGSGNPVEVRHVLKLLEVNLGKRAKIIFKPKPKEDMPMTFADISKAKELLGYTPKVTIEEGVKKFSAWFLNTVSSH